MEKYYLMKILILIGVETHLRDEMGDINFNGF